MGGSHAPPALSDRPHRWQGHQLLDVQSETAASEAFSDDSECDWIPPLHHVGLSLTGGTEAVRQCNRDLRPTVHLTRVAIVSLSTSNYEPTFQFLF